MIDKKYGLETFKTDLIKALKQIKVKTVTLTTSRKNGFLDNLEQQFMTKEKATKLREERNNTIIEKTGTEGSFTLYNIRYKLGVLSGSYNAELFEQQILNSYFFTALEEAIKNKTKKK